jgi:hypothetical protein
MTMAFALPRSQPSPPFERLAPDTYLTDGRRLLRVVSHFDAGADSVYAALEDCLTLEVRPYSLAELGAMGLRPVERAPFAQQPRGESARAPASVPGVAIEVQRVGGRWEVALPGQARPARCETLEEARRVAYLCGARGHACELVVREGRRFFHIEVIDGSDTR